MVYNVSLKFVMDCDKWNMSSVCVEGPEYLLYCFSSGGSLVELNGVYVVGS